MTRSIFVTLSLGLLIFVGGCVSQEDLLRLQSRAEQFRQSIRVDIDQLEDAIQALPEDDPARPDALARLAELEAVDSTVEAAITRVQAVLDESTSPSDPISRLVGWLAPWLPEPVRTPALLASALVVSVVRGRRLKEGFRSVVQGFDRALKDDEAFSQGFKRNAPTFRATQTPLAQRLVDSMSRRP